MLKKHSKFEIHSSTFLLQVANWNRFNAYNNIWICQFVHTKAKGKERVHWVYSPIGTDKTQFPQQTLCQKKKKNKKKKKKY
ncbi:hypothetical protein DDB_G0282519 [Dictyostelium discoideum AX4]|uniref:Uncharacterized protein n=1 Tax=Dictyostelium discoideum TaxID=44689 RepID=Q54SE0_DICDI|nr:hypothetical protein DDB_G0282519 [Dictyostelium discoideum AX4]EAL66119.1 hypothetical protein DDB_G0282519 [Dictyostelium discoideum AX4]|eukprot:XP_640099.1 hypothetical protein DDB_G0282519 [Dictyostelium discoideum AX4]